MKKKWRWMARESKKGWRLGLCIGNDKPRYIKFWFKDKQDIVNITTTKNKIVFVYLANTKEKI